MQKSQFLANVREMSRCFLDEALQIRYSLIVVEALAKGIGQSFGFTKSALHFSLFVAICFSDALHGVLRSFVVSVFFCYNRSAGSKSGDKYRSHLPAS